VNVGFTGTRETLPPERLQSLHDRLLLYVEGADDRTVGFHHGSCVGADAAAAAMAWNLGFRVVSHPPLKQGNLYKKMRFHEELPPVGYLSRNRSIVFDSDVLIAMPSSLSRGTHFTMKFAKDNGVEVIVL